MPVDELRHTLSDASAAVEALSRRLDGRLETEDVRLVDHVRSTIRRFEEVIDALIAYEKATEPLDETPVPLGEVVAAATDLHGDDLQPHDRIDVEDLPTVPGDRSLLLALFRPLVENAIKYQHPQRDLRVRVTAERADGNSWRIVVEDNGIGIDAADAEHVFEMFEANAPGRLPGQGLGLAAARRIAEAHGGTIRAETGRMGTRIIVELPGGCRGDRTGSTVDGGSEIRQR